MMTIRTCLLGYLAALVGIGAALAAVPAGADLGDTQRWQFKVFLDDREIGYHDFEVNRVGDSRRVESRASFDVKILFVNAYRYRHRNTETWNADCLAGIDAATDANGKEFAVVGDRNENGFTLRTGDGEASLPQCVMSFAYWNPAFLDADRLLNAQTGEYENVDIRFDGNDTVTVDGRDIPADRYRIELAQGPIIVWYASADARWLALESVAKGGRILRYQPVQLPPPANTAVARSRAADAERDDA